MGKDALKPKAAPKTPSPLRRWLGEAWGHPTIRLLTTLVVLGGIVTAGTIGVWQQVGPRVIARPEFQLRAEQIQLIPGPETAPWIRRDIRAEALRDGGVTLPQSILEADPGKLARAFALHPWIAQVHRVTKTYPGRVLVELTYRKPIVVVATEGRLGWPVDAAGFVLPGDDFTAADLQRYPTLQGVNAPPPGPAGSRWPDAKVQGAAAIVSALGDAWTSLQLTRIEATATNSADDEPQFELWTAKQTRIVWGRSTREPRPDELSDAEKTATLLEHAAQQGSLDADTSQQFDLRRRGAPIRTPRVVAQPR